MVTKITAVLAALNQAGIRAKRGTLTERAIAPRNPVAVVYPEKSVPEKLVVAVEIFGPKAVGCEDLAYEAVDVLNGIKGHCTVDKCQYSGTTGLFSIKIRAQWDTALAQRVYLDGKLLSNLTGFQVSGTAEVVQTGEATAAQTKWTWLLTMEELLPAGRVPDTAFEGSHTVRVITTGGTEVYSGGYWTDVSQTGDSRGTLRRCTLKCWDRKTE